MRTCIPSRLLVVLVGTCSVACLDEPIVRLEVRASITTERVELRASVQEECPGHDCFRGVHGFDVTGRTPDGRIVALAERPNELSGTYVADAMGLIETYAFYIDGVEYLLDSPEPYTATLALGSDPRIDWQPPLADDETMRVMVAHGTSSGSIGPSPDHVSLAALRPGTYRIELQRQRRTVLSENDDGLPPGLVHFDWVVDLAIE